MLGRMFAYKYPKVFVDVQPEITCLFKETSCDSLTVFCYFSVIWYTEDIYQWFFLPLLQLIKCPAGPGYTVSQRASQFDSVGYLVFHL